MRGKLFAGAGALLCGSFLTVVAQGDPDPITDKQPTLRDGIVYETEFATYVDEPPFVEAVNWDHPLIRRAGAAFGFAADGTQTGVGASRSTMTYYDHLQIYELDRWNDWGRKRWEYEFIDDFRYASEIAELDREQEELDRELQDGSITQSKYDREKGKLDRRREEAEELEALGPEGREERLEEIDRGVAEANYKNFVKSLVGEFRDYPYMVQTKLEILADHTPISEAGEQPEVADDEWLFDSLTGDGYARLRWIMSQVYSARQAKLNPDPSRFNYAWGEVGHVCNRVDNSVKPFTHGEMRYIFAEWLRGPERQFELEAFEAELEEWLAQNGQDGDDDYMYDFRGHKNFKANWMECNAFIWNSRDAARVLQAKIRKGVVDPAEDYAYYQRPFASRYEWSKQLMGAYVFYPSEDHVHLRKASERGGGPHLYVDGGAEGDKNGDGVADYRLFPDVSGSGDIGLESQALPADRVAQKDPTQETVSTFSEWRFRRYRDWGFSHSFRVRDHTREELAENGVFTPEDDDEAATFKLRMSRLNVALDRHTNWGPTHMFSPEAYRLAKRNAVRGAYSPIVAMSYEISKSHGFATGNYPATHPKDRGKTKLMFIVKFRTQFYFDERNLEAGHYPWWDKTYLNESSLSNDFYRERALDKFGWIPAKDMHSAVYLAEADGESSYYPGSTGNSVFGFGLSDAVEGSH